MGRGNGFLAVDLGAESGRVMLGSLADGRLQIAELHRFANGPTREGDTLRWDFARIVAEVERGLSIGAQKAGDDIAGISVNSWGVDFGLLDERGRLIADPYHYRDRQTDGMFEEAFRRVPKRELYERTGIQFMQLNTLYQLLAMRLRNDPALAQARRLVFMADLVAHALCGEVFSEYTLCSTSQLMDMRTGAWSPELLSRLDLPMGILPPVVKPGTVVGKLTAETARDCGCRRVPVIAGASHDTAAAVAAAPALGGSAALTAGEDWAYLSSGTWSLVGIELEKPVITDASFEYDVTNEGGVEGTIRFLKNTAGLWLVQESRRQWQREGSDFSYAQLTEMARQARPFAARLEPDHGDFVAARRHARPDQRPSGARPVRNRCADKGQIVRSMLECARLRLSADARQNPDDDRPEYPRPPHLRRRVAERASQPIRRRRHRAGSHRRPGRGDLHRQRPHAGESRRPARLARRNPHGRPKLIPDPTLCSRRCRGLGEEHVQLIIRQ